jgi:hypothetical protein
MGLINATVKVGKAFSEIMVERVSTGLLENGPLTEPQKGSQIGKTFAHMSIA